MKTRRNFLSHIFLAISAALTAIAAASCGSKPDAATEPSPEWPPKDE
jgi:hypothetical protein